MRIRHVVAHQLVRRGCLPRYLAHIHTQTHTRTYKSLPLRIRHVVTFDFPHRSKQRIARRIAFRGLTFQFVIDNTH